MAASPNVQNYSILKGIVWFKEDGDTAFRDCGNAPKMTYTPTVTVKEHFSQREGINTKDFSAVTQVAAKIDFALDEVTSFSVSIFFQGNVETNTAGDTIIRALSNTTRKGILKIDGHNSVGAQVDWIGNVQFTPTGGFDLIEAADNYSNINIQADVLVDENGDYGVVTYHSKV
ncbi:MAG: hypothetical protein JWL86_5413 [Rhizobium sp.]|nr:hypothetical protein [Rhizobium sp.]